MVLSYHGINVTMVLMCAVQLTPKLSLSVVLPGGGGGGGANTKVPDMYGVGGCFRDPKHKSNMYTFVQQRGGVHILSRITKV